MAAVTICSDFGAQKNKVSHSFHGFPIYSPWSVGTGCHDLSFLNVELKANFFHSPLSLSSRGSLVPLHFLQLEWYHPYIWGCWYFFQQLLVPACDSFIPALHVMYSTYTLNKATRPSRTNNKKDVLFIMGDWNKKVGSQEIPGVTDKFGLGVQTEAGQRLTEFCQENTVFILNTIF